MCTLRLFKPASFADCLGDELPFGWEAVYDSQVGTYYVNHLTSEILIVLLSVSLTLITFCSCYCLMSYRWILLLCLVLNQRRHFLLLCTECNQIEDPRLRWREEQEHMLKEYLADASQDLAVSFIFSDAVAADVPVVCSVCLFLLAHELQAISDPYSQAPCLWLFECLHLLSVYP